MAAWTNPKTWNVGDILTAADMNTYVRDNLSALMTLPVIGQPIISADTNLGANGGKFTKVWLPAKSYTTIEISIGTSAGNIDVAVYTDNAGAPGTLLWHRGAMSSPGTGMQSVSISAGTPTTLDITTPGLYWVGIAGSNSSLAIGATTCPKTCSKSASTVYPLASSNPTVSDANDYLAFVLT